MPPASPPLVSTAMLEGPAAEGAVAVSVIADEGAGTYPVTNPTATTVGRGGGESEPAAGITVG